MTSPAITRHACPGLRPQPLASYLAGLGLVRVLGEQADPAATAAWTSDELVVATAVDHWRALLRRVLVRQDRRRVRGAPADNRRAPLRRRPSDG
jgi:hypothetical protein